MTSLLDTMGATLEAPRQFKGGSPSPTTVSACGLRPPSLRRTTSFTRAFQAGLSTSRSVARTRAGFVTCPARDHQARPKLAEYGVKDPDAEWGD